MIKSLFFITLGITLALAVGCGGQEQSETTPAPVNTEPTESVQIQGVDSGTQIATGPEFQVAVEDAAQALT